MRGFPRLYFIQLLKINKACYLKKRSQTLELKWQNVEILEETKLLEAVISSLGIPNVFLIPFFLQFNELFLCERLFVIK